MYTGSNPSRPSFTFLCFMLPVVNITNLLKGIKKLSTNFSFIFSSIFEYCSVKFLMNFLIYANNCFCGSVFESKQRKKKFQYFLPTLKKLTFLTLTIPDEMFQLLQKPWYFSFSVGVLISQKNIQFIGDFFFFRKLPMTRKAISSSRRLEALHKTARRLVTTWAFPAFCKSFSSARDDLSNFLHQSGPTISNALAVKPLGAPPASKLKFK